MRYTSSSVEYNWPLCDKFTNGLFGTNVKYESRLVSPADYDLLHEFKDYIQEKDKRILRLETELEFYKNYFKENIK